jgi:hypothetical protein
MKKVRYAAGAIGVAPALGLMLAPAAQAAPAPGHPAQNQVKRVALTQPRRNMTAATCGSSSFHSARRGDLQAFVFFASGLPHCVGYQEAFLDFRQSGLTERVRYYGPGGKQIQQSFVPGHFVTASGHTLTEFNRSASVHDVYNACFALVANGNHNNVEYGPLCVGV